MTRPTCRPRANTWPRCRMASTSTRWVDGSCPPTRTRRRSSDSTRLPGTWTKLVDMPTPRGSYGAAFIDGRIVAVGGEEPTRVLATVEMYDIAEGKWTRTTADSDGAARRGRRHGRRHRVLPSAARIGRHTKARSRPSRPSTSPSRTLDGGRTLHPVAQHGQGDRPASDGLIGQTDPAVSLCGIANLSYRFCRCCLMAASVTNSSRAIWRTDASSGNGSPKNTRGGTRLPRPRALAGSAAAELARSTVSSCHVVAGLPHFPKDQP